MTVGDDPGARDGLQLWLVTSATELIGQEPEPALSAALEPHLRAALDSRRRVRVGVDLPNGNGGSGRVEALVLPLADSESPRAVVALAERSSEDEHRLKRFDLALEATRDGVWEWIVGDGAVWWNERCSEILGYPPGTKPTFDGWAARIHPDERERVLAGYLATVASQEPSWLDEYRIVRIDGAVRQVRDHGRVERDANGQAIRLVGVMTDVTDERFSEAARAQITQQFQQIAEHLADVVWLRDAETQQVIYASPAFERIFGRRPEDVMGSVENFLSSVHPEDRARVAARLPKQRSGTYDETYRIVRPDGRVRWLRSRASPVFDGEGRVVRLVGLASDITSQRQLEEQLLQSRKMESVGRLAGGVAHDFNNLLTVMFSGTQFALEQLPADHPARADIEQVKEAAQRAAKLTSQLLAFARRQVIAPVRLDLNELTRQMDQLLRRLIGEHIELTTRLAPDLYPVRADRSQLEQVLVNLAINARDAMPGGGRLTLETANFSVDHAYVDSHANVQAGDYAMLAVSDTGIGIPRELHEHLFEPFFTTKRAGAGTGLGLATCYGTIRQIGGQILLYSEVGQGTTFKILIPRTLEGEAPVAAPTESAKPGGRETVLFVEDDPRVRGMGVRILAQRGYRVLEAAGGKEALALAERHPGPIQLLLTDVVMPQMSGPELAERLCEKLPNLRVLYTSGYTENTIVNHGVGGENVAFLQKPYSVESLLGKVRAVLDQSG